MRQVSANPWYRQAWPWLLMAGPAVVVVAGVVTTWLAFSTADGLVEDDYYKQGLAVNQRMQRDGEAAARGLAAEVLVGDDGRKLRVRLAGDAGAARPDGLALHLAHPTRSGLDQEIALVLGSDGFYTGTLKSPLSGRWRVTLEDAARKWRLTGDWNREREPALRLVSASRSAS